jgi:CheY-like chemotaxis protein
MLSYPDFLRELRHALNNIYEPQILRLSPLQSLLVVDSTGRSTMALGNFLVKAIESLKPAVTTTGDSPTWQTYEFLYYRYVHGASQADLAKQLNCSERQVRRLQNHALAVLAESLLQHAGFAADQVVGHAQDKRPESEAAAVRVLQHEYDALLAGHERSSTEVTTELTAISDVLQPLLLQYATSLRLPPTAGFLNTSIPDVVFRQAFLSMFVAAARLAAGGQIQIAYREEADWVIVQAGLLGAAMADRRNNTSQDGKPGDFAEAAALLALCGGELDVQAPGTGGYELFIRLPAVRFVTVLAVDDNNDILQLLVRYTAGTRYELVTCTNPAAVSSLAAKLNPAAITLDVMMAGVDGWQLIKQLRSDPQTAHIPLVVCSVLAQEELALALGVNDYVRKPVSQEAYLAALDRQSSGRETQSPSGHG